MVQPHRFTRLRDLMEDFQNAFNDADVVFVAPVYAAGEQPIEGIDAAALAEGLRAHGHRMVKTVDSAADLAANLRDLAADGRHDRVHGRGRHHQMGGGAGRRHRRGAGGEMTRTQVAGATDVRGASSKPEPRSRPLRVVQVGRARRKLLFEPADRDDLVAVPRRARSRHAGHGARPGVEHDRSRWRGSGRDRSPRQAVRQGRAARRGHACRCGGGASGILVSSTARDAGIAGLEFLRSIPGTVGGFVRMNGGAYGRETCEILVECEVVLRRGERVDAARRAARLHLSPQRIARGRDRGLGDVPRACPASPPAIQAEMDRIAAAREASQPLRSRTGGSTFKNPPGHKAWALVDAAGLPRTCALATRKCRRSIAISSSTSVTLSSAEIEELGEEVRRRVQDRTNITLEWEIQRIGVE